MSKYSYLNLNQKMIKIRKKIPSLIRKRYSEDVDYDFVKLDDINQFLTPALNRYGVDFDILEETPTQTDASGNPVFLTLEGNLWRYEANLGICWTNADHPEEKITSVIHLVGTNDIADKAKGTAMTYGLKYYLLNKFNIPQNGEEDPDMRGIRTEEGKEKGKEKAAPKETAKKTDRKGTKAEKSGKEAGYRPTDGLEEGLKDGTVPSGARGREVRPVRNGNAVSFPKTQQVSAGQHSKVQPIAETSPDKKEAKPDMPVKKEKGASKDEGQASSVDTTPSEKEEKRPFEVKEEEYQEEINFTDEEDTREETGEDPGDGFRNVEEDDEVPFFESEDEYGEAAADEHGEAGEDEYGKAAEDEYNETAEDGYGEETKEDNVTEADGKVEEAKAVMCNFGLYKGKTLGQMLESQKGWESLKWIATRYMGANKQMKEAAAILVEAGAYAPKAA